MNDQTHHNGMITVLMEHFERQQLGRALGLLRAITAGERIQDHDWHFLEGACRQAIQSKSVVDALPQYQPLFLQTVHLYREISTRALENEKKALEMPLSVTSNEASTA